MINKDRIVPVTKTDLLTLIGTIMALIGTTYTALEPATIDGEFSVTGSGAAGNKLASQPVKSLDFATGVTSGTVYFVAAYDFEGITVAGVAPTWNTGSLETADVATDAATLYKAVLGSSKITLTAVSPVAAD